MTLLASRDGFLDVPSLITANSEICEPQTSLSRQSRLPDNSDYVR